MARVYLAGHPYADDYRAQATLLLGTAAVDPMVRDFRGNERGNAAVIVEGDLAEILRCDVVLANFATPDEGTSMEAWYAYSKGIPVVAYTGGSRLHPWVEYIADAVCMSLGDACAACMG